LILWSVSDKECSTVGEGMIVAPWLPWVVRGSRVWWRWGGYKNIGTYSEYKATNCFKGGVFTQLNGWHGAFDLWTGRVAPYFKKHGEWLSLLNLSNN
jgi:hypothetical protein